MNRVLTYIFALLTLAVSAGCSNEGYDTNSAEDGSAVFSTTITKVSDTQWQSGDQVGVVVTKDGAIYDATTYKFNALYDAQTDGSLEPNSADAANKIYYPIDGTSLSFYAYYPYYDQLSETDKIYPIDVSNQESQSSLDFMEATTRYDLYTYSKSYPNVALSFYRRMAKLTVIVMEGTDVTFDNITGVSLEGFYSTSQYLMSDRAFGSAEDETSIALTNSGSNTYTAILIPMTDSDGSTITSHNNPRMVFQTDLGVESNDQISFVLNDYNIELKAAQHNIYTVRVNHEGVSVSGGISGWDNTEPESLTTVERVN